METCFIYALLDPTTKIARYIGKSIDPENRFKGHIRDAKIGEVTHKANWVRSLLNQKLQPELLIIEECELSKWDDREKFYIKLHREFGNDLTNANEGGIRFFKKILEPINRKKRDIFGKKNPFYGKRHTAETKAKLSKVHAGKILTEEHKQKVRQSQLGTKRPPRNEQWREKQRASHLGRKDSETAFEKKSKAQSGSRNGNAKVWKLRSPNGDVIEIKSLKTWCSENGLSVGKIHYSTKKQYLDEWTILS